MGRDRKESQKNSAPLPVESTQNSHVGRAVLLARNGLRRAGQFGLGLFLDAAGIDQLAVYAVQVELGGEVIAGRARLIGNQRPGAGPPGR